MYGHTLCRRSACHSHNINFTHTHVPSCSTTSTPFPFVQPTPLCCCCCCCVLMLFLRFAIIITHLFRSGKRSIAGKMQLKIRKIYRAHERGRERERGRGEECGTTARTWRKIYGAQGHFSCCKMQTHKTFIENTFPGSPKPNCQQPTANGQSLDLRIQ